MALSQEFQIAHGKFDAHSKQATLLGEVQKSHALQSDLKKAIASQQVLDSMISRQQAVHRQEMEHAKYLWAGQELEQRKIGVALQGFTALTQIYHNISYTSALLMGFTAGTMAKTNLPHSSHGLRYAFISVCLLAEACFIHGLFVAALANVDGTKLAYQGTKGIADITRAFHGLVQLRSGIFWSYVAGFMGYTMSLNATVIVFAAEDHARSLGPDNVSSGLHFDKEQWRYLIILTGCAWSFFVTRLVWCFCNTRRIFRMDYDMSSDPDLDGAEAVAHCLDLRDDFSIQLGPQSLRRGHQRRRSSDQSSPQGSRLSSSGWSPAARHSTGSRHATSPRSPSARTPSPITGGHLPQATASPPARFSAPPGRPG
eukprot:TRINITY_DN2958_c3_g1_i1.p1 TRINITY_DN2958_c3_g1~~TRINITY_DN2958_c3_g1_i1.p1  ORF type:complete len:400 (+),score=94.62 TRINITY_DN2958_c3_g1_i1:92-1201(+)